MTSAHESFEKEKAFHAELISRPPIPALGILESLKRILKTGEEAARTNEIGTVRFANETTELFAGALALNQSGKVEPPFTDKNISAINLEIDRLSVFTQGNGDTGPTDVNDLPTTDKK